MLVLVCCESEQSLLRTQDKKLPKDDAREDVLLLWLCFVAIERERKKSESGSPSSAFFFCRTFGLDFGDSTTTTTCSWFVCAQGDAGVAEASTFVFKLTNQIEMMKTKRKSSSEVRKKLSNTTPGRPASETDTLSGCAQAMAEQDAVFERKVNGALAPSKLVFDLSRYGIDEYRMMERDRSKYLLYYAAINKAVRSILEQQQAQVSAQQTQQQPEAGGRASPVPVVPTVQFAIKVLVAGAGMGPLIGICQDVIRDVAGARGTVFALDGNPFAVEFLVNKFSQRLPQRTHPQSSEDGKPPTPTDVKVHVVPFPVVIRPGMKFPPSLDSHRQSFDLCVSEVLGSAGCNEFFPEIDSVLRSEFLKPVSGIAVPEGLMTFGALAFVEPPRQRNSVRRSPRRLGAVSASVGGHNNQSGNPRKRPKTPATRELEYSGTCTPNGSSSSSSSSSSWPDALYSVDWTRVKVLTEKKLLWTHSRGGSSSSTKLDDAANLEPPHGDGISSVQTCEPSASAATKPMAGATERVTSRVVFDAWSGSCPKSRSLCCNAVALGFRALLFENIALDTFDLKSFSWEAGMLPLQSEKDLRPPLTLTISRSVERRRAPQPDCDAYHHELWYEWAVGAQSGSSPELARTQRFVL